MCFLCYISHVISDIKHIIDNIKTKQIHYNKNIFINYIIIKFSKVIENRFLKTKRVNKKQT